MLLAWWSQGRMRVGWVADDLRFSCTGSQVGTLVFIRDTHVDDHSVQGWLRPIRSQCVQGRLSPFSPPLIQALSLSRLVGWGTIAFGPAEGLVVGKALSQFQQAQWLPRVTQQSPSPTHPMISPLDILYKNFEDKLVSFRKIFIVSTYLPSHTSVTDVSTFSTMK